MFFIKDSSFGKKRWAIAQTSYSLTNEFFMPHNEVATAIPRKNANTSKNTNTSANTNSKTSSVHNSEDMQSVTHFLLELDALKHVNRRNHITPDESGQIRVENSAEHSWHLAMACWSIAELFKLKVDHEKLLKMALIHDLGEIDAGDTFLYAKTRNDAHLEERDGIARLQNERGNGIADLSEIWEEQETGNSAETQLLKVIDRLLPFLLNLNTQGKTWIELGIRRTQVADAHAFIADSFPVIHQWLAAQIDYATKQGWLIDN